MSNEEFCKLDTKFYGEVVDNVKQIKYRSFTGEELKEYVEHCIKLRNHSDIGDVNVRAIGIKSASSLIQSIPMDQAIQQIKSKLTGRPETSEIKGELIVTFKPES